MVEIKVTWSRVSGLCGILAPIIAFTCVLLAIASYPQFSWTDNALSDLGIMAGVTAMLFNSGLIVSGVLMIGFGIGLPVLLGSRLLAKIGALIFIFDALALFAIGVFPESVKPMHYYASVAFFALLPISMLMITAAFLLMARRKTGLFTLLAAMVAGAVWIVQFSVRFVPDVAIPETVSALSGSIWSVVLGFKMIKTSTLGKRQ